MINLIIFKAQIKKIIKIIKKSAVPGAVEPGSTGCEIIEIIKITEILK